MSSILSRMLRIFFKYNRRLLGELCRCALRPLVRYFEIVAGRELMPGIIAAIQTFGDRINLHPHLHFMVTEGGVDKAGSFHKIPRIDDSRLAELFGREVLRLLVGQGLLSPEWAERILSWRHTGFNVHSRVRAKIKREAERVGGPPDFPHFLPGPRLLVRFPLVSAQFEVRQRSDLSSLTMGEGKSGAMNAGQAGTSKADSEAFPLTLNILKDRILSSK